MVTDNTSQADDTTAFLRAARSGNLEKVVEFLDTDLDINTANSNGLNALHLASKDGHVEIVTELLKRGAKVDAATKKGNTALHIASLAGQAEIVNILIQYGAAVNIQSQNGFTPLYMAAQENHDQVVKLLLSNGANQSLATEDGFTPLAVAMQQGHDKVVSVLLENDSKGRVRLPALHIAAKKDDCKAADLLLQNDHKPDVTSKSGFTPLHIAAHYGNEEIARLLIKRGADVNYLAKHNISPLHVAAKWGKNNMVKVLLENCAQIDAKTRDGLTPLHCAARSGHEEVVTTLLENSAPISARTKNGLAPLHMASQGDHVDAARVLLFHRAPVDEVTIDYLTSLHVAAHCGHVRVAKLLLDRKADPNARALNGFTPLHIACKKNRIKVVELLLKHGASIESTTESGLTPLHVASFMGCMNIVIFLLQHEANPDVPTVRGETPLHLAARANQTDIIRILLRNGAKVDARAREQQTPLHIASRLGNIDIVMLLLQHGAAVDTTTKDMYTALHIAAKEGQEEVATILVENNASLKATTKNGFTPLHVAAKYGNMNVAKILLQKDSKLDAQGKNDITPLQLACHYDHPNVANLLLEKGASPHLASQNGHTPLHIAARKNQMDIASTLLETGASANAESKAGFTPLHLSAQKGHYDMTNLLIEHGADPNHKAKNGLTALHLCAQEDFIRVASILVKNGANVESQTETGYRPIHVAAHFGNLSMIRFLLKQNAEIDVRTNQNYTPLHQAAQQGHAHIVTALLEGNASHKARTKDGLTALNIAQKLGYISVMEVLKGLSYDTLTPDNKNWEEKYKVIAPESLQETSLMSDSDDDGGSDALISEQPYRYLTADLMKSLRDDSLPIDVTRDDPIQRPVTTEEKQEFAQSNNYCLAENFDNNDGLNIGRLHFRSFLVSFLVDARGGTMKGCRHSGVRIIVPPRRATMPIRVTCRLIKPSKVANPPPLMEGEALATRIIEMGPVGATFLGPVLIDIPHFASIRGKEREIIILRSENGETWKEHDNSADNDDTLLSTPFDAQMSASHSDRITRIVTTDFPQYFAIVTRIKQEVHVIGAEGGILISSVANHVQAVFPPGALTKKIKVGLQAHVIPAELTAKLLGNCVAVSPVITIEPRRRKFHKPITLTIPVPQAANKGMINQYGGETPTLRLLCSIAGGTSESQWEDVTGSTPLTFMNDRVSFTTTVSARFWLMDCRNIDAVPKMATELYEESVYVPYITNFVIYSKRMDILEATLRILCMTDGKEGMHTLEKQEEFLEIVKSRDVEALDGKDLYIEFSGNLIPVTKSGVQLKFTFKAFRQNRLSFHVKVKDPLSDPVARMLFMREPKVAKGEPPQQPICVLNIVLPEIAVKSESQKAMKDYEDSNIINQKIDLIKSKYSMEQKEKCDQPKDVSPTEKKFITDTLQKEQTDAAIHESLAQKAACPLESVDASYPNKLGGQDLSPTVEKQTYSEKRKFWEDISRKRDSYQRSESEISRASQITVNESDSENLQNIVSEEDATDVASEITSEVAKSETMEDVNVPDISECSVAEKAHYFEEQIQKELAKVPAKLQHQESVKSDKERITRTKSIEEQKIAEKLEMTVVQVTKETVEVEEKYVKESRQIEKTLEQREEIPDEVMKQETIRKIVHEEVQEKERKTAEKSPVDEKDKDESKMGVEPVKEICKEMIMREREIAEDMTKEKAKEIQVVKSKEDLQSLEERKEKLEVHEDDGQIVGEEKAEESEEPIRPIQDVIKERKDLSGKGREFDDEAFSEEAMSLSLKASELAEKSKRESEIVQVELEMKSAVQKDKVEEPVVLKTEISKVAEEAIKLEAESKKEEEVEKIQRPEEESEAVQKEMEMEGNIEYEKVDEPVEIKVDVSKVTMKTVKVQGVPKMEEEEEVEKVEELEKEPEFVERDVEMEFKAQYEKMDEPVQEELEISKATVRTVKVQGVPEMDDEEEVEDIQKLEVEPEIVQKDEKMEFKEEYVKVEEPVETKTEISKVTEEIGKVQDELKKKELLEGEKVQKVERSELLERAEKLGGKHKITEETTIVYKVQKDGTLVQELVTKSVQIEGPDGRSITQVPEVDLQSISEIKAETVPLGAIKKEIQEYLEEQRGAQDSELLEASIPETETQKTEHETIIETHKMEEAPGLLTKVEEIITKQVIETKQEGGEKKTIISTTKSIGETESKQLKKEFESRIPISAAKAEKDKAQKEAKTKTEVKSPTEKPENGKMESGVESPEITSPIGKKKEFESRIPKRVTETKSSDKVAKKDVHTKKESETYTVTEKKSSEEVTSKHEEHKTTKSETQTFSKTVTDPEEAFKIFEGMDNMQKDFATVTSKVDHKTSSKLEKKETVSSEISSGSEKIITHEEKERVERKKSSESKVKKESPEETMEERKTKHEETDRTAVQKLSMNLSEGKEVIDASAAESRVESKKEEKLKKLEGKEGVMTHETGSSRLRESDADVAIRIKRDVPETEDRESIETVENIAEKITKSMLDADDIELISKGESHRETRDSFDVKQFVPSEKEKPKEPTPEETDAKIPPKTLEEMQLQKFKEIEARTIAETLLQSIESEIEGKSPTEMKSSGLSKEYLEQAMADISETDDEKLADDLTRKFESIMKKSTDEDKDKEKDDSSTTESVKLRTPMLEETLDKGSTRDSISISEDITKDEESSLQDKEGSFPLSLSQVRFPDRDITMSPSSISEPIEFEETVDVDTNVLEDVSKPSSNVLSEKPPSNTSSGEMERKIMSEASGARVLEILEPGVETQSRQDSMDVPSLEMDEHRVSELTSKGIPSLHESVAVDSLEKIAQERDMTMSPTTVSDDINMEYSISQDDAPPIMLPKDYEGGMKRADSFEIESPPMVSPRSKVQGLEIKPVNWMIGDEKIEISETLQPSQVFNQELEEYEMRQKSRLPSQDGSTDLEQESVTKSSEEISVIESVKEPASGEVQVTIPTIKTSKFTVVPVTDPEFDSDLIENKLDITCQELVETLQREYEAKTPTDEYAVSLRQGMTQEDMAELERRLSEDFTREEVEDSQDERPEIQESSIKSSESPIKPTEILIKPTDIPIKPTDIPVKPTEIPIKPIEISIEPAEISIEPAEICVELIKAPVEDVKELDTGKVSEEDKVLEEGKVLEADKVLVKDEVTESDKLLKDKVPETDKSLEKDEAPEVEKVLEKDKIEEAEKVLAKEKIEEAGKVSGKEKIEEAEKVLGKEKIEEAGKVSGKEKIEEAEKVLEKKTVAEADKVSEKVEMPEEESTRKTKEARPSDISEKSEIELKKPKAAEEATRPDVELKLEQKTEPLRDNEKLAEDTGQESEVPKSMDDVLKEFTEAYLSKMKSSGDDYKRHTGKSTEKHERSGRSSVPSDTGALKKKKDDHPSVDLSARYAITVLDQVVKKEIAEIKESLEAAKQDLIEELSENSETVIQIKDSPSEFQFKLQPESIPNDLPFLYRPPSPESKSESPIPRPRPSEGLKQEEEDTSDSRLEIGRSISSSIDEQDDISAEKSHPMIGIEKAEIQTKITVHEDIKSEEEGHSSPVPASRSGSDADNKDESSSLAPPQPVPRRRHKPARAPKRVTSDSDAEVGSSSGESSYYQSCEYDIGSGSRPSSSDIEALHSAAFASATASEYETAIGSGEQSTGSKLTSQEYQTAATTLSSRESMKSFQSLSSGHLGSIDSTSELSETLVASEADEEKDDDDDQLDRVLDDDQSESSGSEIPLDEGMDKIDSNVPCRMKRSSEMIFQQIIDDNAAIEVEPVESLEEDVKAGVDSATSALTSASGAVESVDIMTARVSEDGTQSVCTQVTSTQAVPVPEPESTATQEETGPSDSDLIQKEVESGVDLVSMEPDSLEPRSTMSGIASDSPDTTIPSSALSLTQQASMSTSSTSAISVETVVEKEKTSCHSPDSDSFELVDKPDIIDDFVVIEEVGREAEEYDSEGKSIQISSLPQTSSKQYDRDLENLITETKEDSQVSTSQTSKNNELFDFESEESPPQADRSNEDQYSQSYSDEEPYEGKKWIEMQFQADARVYDLEYDRGPLEDIKEEEITDFEAGSSRFGSLGSHKESIGSVGSMRGSFGSTPEYDVLAGKKYFTRPADHDNVSLSSLQEFENLESAVAAENSKGFQCGSQDSVNNGSLPKRYRTSRSGHGDDISLSSLKDFEGLEKACREAHLIELRAREEEDLLEHESPENRYKVENLPRSKTETSAAGSFNPSTSGSDDYDKRIKEIDEIIRIAQANVEKVDRQDDTMDDISQIEITDAEKERLFSGAQLSTEPVMEQDEPDDLQIQREANIMETSTDSLELEASVDKKQHPLYRSSDSLEMKTTLDVPSLSSDSLNNVRDNKEQYSDVGEQGSSSMRRMSSDSLEIPEQQQDPASQERRESSNGHSDPSLGQTPSTEMSVQIGKTKQTPESDT